MAWHGAHLARIFIWSSPPLLARLSRQVPQLELSRDWPAPARVGSVRGVERCKGWSGVYGGLHPRGLSESHRLSSDWLAAARHHPPHLQTASPIPFPTPPASQPPT